MIKIEEIEKDYYRCQSCNASKDRTEMELFNISVGLSQNNTSSFRLCLKCIYDLKLQLSIIR